MSIPRYRIGNDLSVLWAVNNRDGSPYNLDGKEVHLFVTNDRGRYEVPVIIETLEDGTTNNVVRWDFRGEQQRVLGTYTLTLEITNTADSKEIKRDKSEAFSLVCCSESESIEDGEPNIQDGGELILATKLDIYRFGVAKIEIGVNGNWFIDGVDTGRPSFAGEGLVNKIYKATDFGRTFAEDSKIDTFNAYAINSLFLGVSKAAEDIADLYKRLEGGGVINKDVADRLDKLEKNQFFERYDDQTIKTKYNLFSDHEISAFGLNAGTGGGSGGEGGASHLKDLWDVTIVSAANNDILVYNGTHWVNKPQSSIMPDLSVLNNYLLKTEAAELYLVKDAAKDFASASSVTDLSNALVRLSETYGNRLNALEKIVQWFHLTQDEQAIYTEKNFYSEKEISAHGLNLGGGSGEGGAIELGNIIGVSLHSPVTGDVFVYNGTHWTNISQSELVPDLSGYATTDSVSTVSNRVNTVDNKVKSLEDRLNDLESEKLFFKLEGADDVIYTPYNLFSEKEISAHGLNYGSGSGASGLLTDLLDVKAEDSTSGDLLVFDGTHWINTPQSAIVPSIDTSVIATREWVGQNYASTSDLSNGVKDAKGYTDALRTHVNEQDQILSGQIAKILDWFTLEDGVLLTKYNLASEKEVSAKGINASQGGGTSYNRLDSWSAYDSSKAGYVLSALLGYDLHSRVTNLENAEVDLSDYYTKSQTNSQIASAIGAIDLNPYATKAALNILEGKHNTLRNEFDALNNLLSSDTTDYINTWNEVVAFLDGYKDESDLATILSGMNADISSRLLSSDFESWKTNTFTPLVNLVDDHTTRLNRVDKTIEDHIAEFIAFRANFEISDDLILVRKNFASTEEVSAKGINQGTGGGGGSSYSRLDTWEGYDNNKAGYVLSAGLGYGLKVAIDELNGYDLDNRFRSIENSYVSKDAGGVINGGLIANSFTVSGGSSSQFLKADGSLDSTSYLSTAGGTISNGIWAYQLNLNALNTDAGLRFSINGALKGLLRVDSNQDLWYQGASENLLLHSGNVGEFALSTSGGKIAVNSGIQWGDTNNVIYATASTMHIDTDSNLFINGKQVIHEGNVGSYNAGGLMTGASHQYAQHNDTDKYIVFGYQTARNGYSTTIDGTSITFRDGGSNPTMLINSAGNVTIGDRDKAITSAKLYVDGTIIGGSVGTSTLGWDANTNTGLCVTSNGIAGWVSEFGNGTQGVLLGCRGESQNVASIGSVGGTTLALNPDSGNVGIGTTDPQAKLHVNGVTRIQRDYDPRSYLDIAVDDISVNYNGYDTDGWCSHYFNSNGITRMAIIGLNGYVGIGTPSPSYKLDVIGDIRATESITIGGATLSWENGALKVNTSFYSEKEISAKGLSTGGGSGASYNRLDAWGDYDSSKAGYVLSAYLGNDLNTRLSSLSGVVDTHTSRLSSLENAGYITSSALSGYLPLSGGEIKSQALPSLMINRNGGGAVSSIGFKCSDSVFYGYLGFDDVNRPIWMDASYNRYPLIHFGNIGEYAITPSTIGSQSVAYATNAGGIQGSTSSINFARGHNRLEMINDNSGSTGDFATGYQSGISVITEYVGWQMTSFGGGMENPYFRSLEDTGRWKPWRQIAFTDSDITGNASSATKLQTPRTIWGQSFDGTGDVDGSLTAGATTLSSLTVSGLSTFTGGVVAYDIHGNGQSLYLGNASNNAYIKVREDMVGSSSMWSIPRDGRATFTSLTTPTLSVTGSATIASVTIDAGNATLSNLTVNTVATLKQLVVGIDGMSCNGPATFNDFIYGSSITPRTDNYYVLGNNNYKWYAVTAYNVNVHDAITIEAGKELRFKDNNGEVHTLKYDSAKQAFVFDGNVNATGEISAKKLNA